MKYIYGILGIVLLLSCVMWGISATDSADPPEKNSLVVNQRAIPFAELQQLWQEKPYHYQSEREFVDDLVLRELLIQEAIAAGIAEEDQFKRLIRDFFEQSLIKTLLDRQQTDQQLTVSAAELSRFRQARQQYYQLTLLRYQNYPESRADEQAEVTTMKDDYSLLPEAVQVHLLSLNKGELSAPFADGADFVQIRVEQIGPAQNQSVKVADEELRQQLVYMRQQQLLGEWLLQLRQQAEVQYPQRQLSKGGD